MVICMTLMAPQIGHGQEISPVKNTVPLVTRSISRMEVYWMYTMRTRFFPDGTRITVFYQDYTSQAHKDFVNSVLRTTPSSFEQSVSVYINSGNAAYFRQISNMHQMQSEIAKLPGAIGYLSKDIVMINKGHGNVETLKIVD